MPRVLFSTLVSNKRNQDSLQRRQIPGLGQETYEISLEHLVIPENKQRLEKGEGMLKKKKSTGVNQKVLSMVKTGKSEQ